MRRGFLVPLGISVAIHIVIIGAGELLSSGDTSAEKSPANVVYGPAAADGTENDSRDKERAAGAGAPAGAISIETSDPRYRPYFSSLRRDIEKTWQSPRAAGGAVPEGTLVVLFTLDRSGKLLEISVHRSSGERALDFAAVDSVKRAAPFNAFPSEITAEKLAVKALFVYD